MGNLTSEFIHLFNEGRQTRAYQKLGAHIGELNGESGVWFSIWAPGVKSIAVCGDFNGWSRTANELEPVASSGIWSGFVPHAEKGQTYKYHIVSPNGYTVDKADPFATLCEEPPKTASRIWDEQYDWQDVSWMKERAKKQATDQAMSIYEVHLGSWRRNPEQGARSLTYRELAEELPAYVKQMGFTHVELMPIMEHPFYGSWGYQTTGYFAPTSRYGNPEDFKFLVDRLHQEGIGVILDWVPSHFPSDEFSLGFFNGTHLFEHEDERKGYHPDWKSLIFNYGRNEVKSFLISSAMVWLDQFHVDGIRVDAVASMLYLDYSRKEGEWIPNKFGGRENLEAIEFMRELNTAIYREFPDVHTIAEESTAWPKVSAPVFMGGLGYGMKWDMGWMHDTLDYFKKDPIYRNHHQGQLTFRMVYAFNENFVLSLSHDEVVYGKGSMIEKMAGDEWNKFANLRTLYAYMYAQPGKKLMFMGCEFAQQKEWAHEGSLDWHLLLKTDHVNRHLGTSDLVRDLNHLYRDQAALHDLDFSQDGFEWLDASDAQNCIMSFFRKSKTGEKILCIFNMTPVPRMNYRLGVDHAGVWNEVLNTDAKLYGGSGYGNLGSVKTNPVPAHGRTQSVTLTLPPLSAVFLKHGDDSDVSQLH